MKVILENLKEVEELLNTKNQVEAKQSIDVQIEKNIDDVFNSIFGNPRRLSEAEALSDEPEVDEKEPVDESLVGGDECCNFCDQPVKHARKVLFENGANTDKEISISPDRVIKGVNNLLDKFAKEIGYIDIKIKTFIEADNSMSMELIVEKEI